MFTIFTVLYLILLYVQQESQVAYGRAGRPLPSQIKLSVRVTGHPYSSQRDWLRGGLLL